jgi:5-methylcytosine-specific restriction endonuclease McrA
VPFDPSRLEAELRAEWDDLAERAQKATKAVLDAEDASDAPPLRQDIWKAIKEFLFKHAFSGKCAYCESYLRGQSFGDAEHWRPKSQVRRADRSIVAGHKGYAWLAHEWENLVPSCQVCNNRKGARFPIAGEYVMTSKRGKTTKALNKTERPLLLHPFDDGARDPVRHIRFDRGGFPQATTAEGRATIDICELDREDLVDARRERFKQIDRAMKPLMGLGLYADLHGELSEWYAPEEWFSHASKNYIDERVPVAVAAMAAEMIARYEAARSEAEQSAAMVQNPA